LKGWRILLVDLRQDHNQQGDDTPCPNSNLHTLSQPEVTTNDPLHELIQQGARDLIAQAVET